MISGRSSAAGRMRRRQFASRRQPARRRASTSAIGRVPSAMAAAIASSVSSCVSRLPIAITMSAPATSAFTAAWPAP
jgi:hypothetical protein